ncbi:phosphatidylinositol transfer protein beta isoform isoform X1 [Folsomia candida]|uniref:phosphatidylinositol transfer protein beta isoform isoform X1 n=1 Tax=Folsomia candida TaxID=158441 RepID=UPI0016053A46|nr:phosphatidylinositol transfer protein beta isoform isoform X1 [Folsomia candida]
MLVKEYRIILPLTVEEYQIGQLYSIAQASRNETGGGDGIQVITNESFENQPLLGHQFPSGQYTKKKYYLANKVGGLVKTLLPKSALVLEENAWNAYPYCRTILTNEYMGSDFGISIETYHLPGKGEHENVHQLTNEKLAQREVVIIDIAGELLDPADYDKDEDPRLHKSLKCDRGPLTPGWINTVKPVMTCYKLVTCHFNWFGLQTRVEKLIQKYEMRLFTKFHRQVYCWLDNWYELTLEDIRNIELQVQEELENQRIHGALRGICNNISIIYDVPNVFIIIL